MNERKRGKKGLSDVVTTLIIVLVSLVAIGGVWFVVNNLIKGGTQNVEVGAKCLNIDLKATRVDCADGVTNQLCNVTFSRTGSGSDEIAGVKIVLRDEAAGVNSGLIDVIGNIEPLVGKVENDIDSGISNNNTINKIDVTVYFEDDAGNEQLCSQTGSTEF